MDGQKCAHQPCSCYVDLGHDYCSQRCRDAEAKDPDLGVHESCGCHHDECMASA